MHRKLWILAFLFFGIADLSTTYIGFQLSGIYEANPIFHTVDYAALVAVKIAVIFLFWQSYIFIESAYSDGRAIGIPAGLAFLGGCITVWNSAVIWAVIV